MTRLDRWLLPWHRRRTARSNAKARARMLRQMNTGAVTTHPRYSGDSKVPATFHPKENP